MIQRLAKVQFHVSLVLKTTATRAQKSFCPTGVLSTSLITSFILRTDSVRFPSVPSVKYFPPIVFQCLRLALALLSVNRDCSEMGCFMGFRKASDCRLSETVRTR